MCPGIFTYGSSTPAAPQAIKNIEAFAKLYGYVKYFHPSDEAYKIDWDRFAIYGVKRVEPAKNSIELKKILEELFLPIAPSVVIYPSAEKASFSLSTITPGNTTGMKLIAWQHYGVHLNRTPRDYESIRLHRKVKYTPGFGNLMQGMNAEPFRGKEFIYKAAVKAERGKAQLWFRVDRLNRQDGFFDNMRDRPIKSNTWKTYEIKGTIDDDAVNIVFGCFLTREGKIFADDFQLLIKEGDQWKPAEIKNSDFEEDREGEKPKAWEIWGKGYVFQVTTQAPAKGSKCFMIEPAPLEKPGRLYTRNPKFGEYFSKELGMGLSCIVPLALYGTKVQTYPAAPGEKFKNLVNALKTEVPKTLTANDGYVRWANVVIAWNVFQHFYPNFHIVKVDWKSQLTRTLQKAQTDTNEMDFLQTLREMVAALQDGQGSVSHPLENDYSGFPFKVEWIENHVVITASNDKQFQKGDIILAVNGVDAEQVLKKAETFISGSPQRKRTRALDRFGFGPPNTTAQLKIQREGKTMDITTSRNFKGNLEEFPRKSIEEFKDHIVYVDLTKITRAEAISAIDKLTAAKGVILDARGNGESFAVREVFSHLVDTDMLDFITSVPEVIYPDRENVEYTGYDFAYPGRTPKIKGKKVFIIDSRATYTSETFIGIAKHHKLGEIVGQPTAAVYGMRNSFIIPGRYRVSWTGMRVLKQDRSPFFLKGTAPTVPVQRTIKGVKQSRDEFLEKAIEIVSSAGQ
jgi:C-terminal processing protease CtpA/Prc